MLVRNRACKGPYLADAVILLNVANEEVRAMHLFELSHIGESLCLENMCLESVLVLRTDT